VVQSTETPARSRLVLLKKAGSFAAIGLVNAAIDFAVFWSLAQALDIPGMPAAQAQYWKVGANVAAWAVAVTASYVMNSFITFAAESGGKLRWNLYTKFVAGGVAGMIANTAALLIGDWVLSYVVTDADWRLAIAKVGAIGVSFVVNFSMSHFVVFRPRVAANDN
jgi:putative flippase GtrA